MSEDNSFLRDLDSIVERSKSSRQVDAAVDYTVNSKAREALLERLTLLHNQIADKYSRATQFGAFSAVVIRSHKGILKPHNLIFDIETNDARLRIPIRLYGPSGWGSIDNLYDRSLYFNEYERRYQALSTALEKGLLDDRLGYSPEVLIHSILGFSGELLPFLGIDPKRGETYTSLKSTEKPMQIVQYQQLATSISQILEARSKAKLDEPKTIAEVKQPTTEIGYIIDPELGLSISYLTEEHREIMGLPKEINGVIVINVVKGSPAHKAGVKGCDRKVVKGKLELSVGGDIILEADGKNTGTASEFTQWQESKPAAPSLRIFRDGSTINLTINI